MTSLMVTGPRRGELLGRPEPERKAAVEGALSWPKEGLVRRQNSAPPELLLRPEALTRPMEVLAVAGPKRTRAPKPVRLPLLLTALRKTSSPRPSRLKGMRADCICCS